MPDLPKVRPILEAAAKAGKRSSGSLFDREPPS